MSLYELYGFGLYCSYRIGVSDGDAVRTESPVQSEHGLMSAEERDMKEWLALKGGGVFTQDVKDVFQLDCCVSQTQEKGKRKSSLLKSIRTSGAMVEIESSLQRIVAWWLVLLYQITARRSQFESGQIVVYRVSRFSKFSPQKTCIFRLIGNSLTQGENVSVPGNGLTSFMGCIKSRYKVPKQVKFSTPVPA